MTVAESVEHPDDDLAGDRDLGDRFASPFGDPVVVGFEERPGTELLSGFDRGPPHQAGSLFGDPAPVNLVVGLAVAGVSPVHDARCRPDGNRVSSPISAMTT